ALRRDRSRSPRPDRWAPRRGGSHVGRRRGSDAAGLRGVTGPRHRRRTGGGRAADGTGAGAGVGGRPRRSAGRLPGLVGCHRTPHPPGRPSRRAVAGGGRRRLLRRRYRGHVRPDSECPMNTGSLFRVGLVSIGVLAAGPVGGLLALGGWELLRRRRVEPRGVDSIEAAARLLVLVGTGVPVVGAR